MKVSVIMATYNGEQYIKQQLDTIRKQSRKPDEVIIADDVSTDGTVDTIKKYIDEYDLKTWEVYENQSNCGWEENFIHLMKYCSGDIVFYSDQDDIWSLDKIRDMAGQMEHNDNILCLAGKLNGIDSKNRTLDLSNVFTFKSVLSTESGLVKKVDFTEDFLIKFYPGCVCAIRKQIIDDIFTLGELRNFPDRQICRIANIRGGLYTYDKIVISHRLHDNNAGGNIKQLNGNGTRVRRQGELRKDVAWLKAYIKNPLVISSEKEKIINKCFDIYSKRMRYLDGDMSFIGLLAYLRSYRNMIIPDFCYRHNINRQVGYIYSIISKLK